MQSDADRLKRSVRVRGPRPVVTFIISKRQTACAVALSGSYVSVQLQPINNAKPHTSDSPVLVESGTATQLRPNLMPGNRPLLGLYSTTIFIVRVHSLIREHKVDRCFYLVPSRCSTPSLDQYPDKNYHTIPHKMLIPKRGR